MLLARGKGRLLPTSAATAASTSWCGLLPAPAGGPPNAAVLTLGREQRTPPPIAQLDLGRPEGARQCLESSARGTASPGARHVHHSAYPRRGRRHAQMLPDSSQAIPFGAAQQSFVHEVHVEGPIGLRWALERIQVLVELPRHVFHTCNVARCLLGWQKDRRMSLRLRRRVPVFACGKKKEQARSC
eukprot:scaffold418_cov386-Prasinococcus_capsulatus_cf.AAC.31